MNPRKKALIILSPGFPANEADTTCLPFPQSFVKNLQTLNPSLHVIVIAFQYPFFAGVYQWNGVEVHALNGRSRGKIRRLLTWHSVNKKIHTIMQTAEVIGVLNFWLGECALMGSYAAKKYKVPAYTWLLGQDARQNNRYFSLLRPPATGLVALSDAIADELYKNYHTRPAHTIPAGIDTSLYPPLTAGRKIDIMGAGSLIPLKQYDQFIRIVARLVLFKPNLSVILCGSGPEEKKLRKLIHDNNVDRQVQLVGELAHDSILALLQESKIFLHPSSYEGFSTVCAEALYAGAHVVSFQKPMKRDFEHLHIVDSLIAMEAMASALLNNPALNHDRVLTYPMAACCQQILELYN